MKLSAKTTQRGAVLMVGLIMLLLLTLIGMAAIRGSTLQERMAGNMRDRNVAFQAAEAGISTAEAVLNGAAIPDFGGGTLGYGQPVDNPGSVTFWETFNWGAGTVALRPNLNLQFVNSQPQYYVEEVLTTPGSDPSSGVDLLSTQNNGPGAIYRTTSRATGGSADTVVILQSTFSRGD